MVLRRHSLTLAANLETAHDRQVALKILTLNTESHSTLRTSIRTLTRVLEVVNWATISKGNPEAWLYFYEDFLSVYDGDLRKKTGSYYTHRHRS